MSLTMKPPQQGSVGEKADWDHSTIGLAISNNPRRRFDLQRTAQNAKPAMRCTASHNSTSHSRPPLSSTMPAIKYIDHADFADPARAEEILAPWQQSELPPVVPPENVPSFVADIYQYQLLSPQGEVHLFRQMNYLKYRAETLRCCADSSATSETRRREIESLLSRAVAVRNEIMQSNQRLAISIAKKFVRPTRRLDELMSDANVALLQAVDGFDISRGYRFSTYASHSMYRRLMRLIRKHDKEQSRRELLDSVPVTDIEVSEDSEIEYDESKAIAAVLSQLTSDERQIVQLRFGLEKASKPLTFREIGAIRGVSGERIRQILWQAIGRVRDTLLVDVNSRWFVEQFV